MEVILAGYNIDADVLAELSAGQNRQDITPETVSAAYARISRDPRPVTELRRIARQEVEKARRSNSNIVFKMGHHSIAEHAVFNFDILNLSRLALEELEKFRLCSYTEKSQRYQKLEDNFVLPAEIKASPYAERFIALIKEQNQAYQDFIAKGIEPEDARYITSLATCGQLGMTMNARNLELLVRRFACSGLAEVRQLGDKIFEQTTKIAPSLILFTAANAFDRDTYSEIAVAVKRKWERKRKNGQICELVDYTEKADDKLAVSLLHSVSQISYRDARRIIKEMTKKDRLALIKKAFQNMEFYDSTLREFEHLSLTFDLVLSSAAFAQLKRHRMATITSQKYETELGYTIPPSILAKGEERGFKKILEQSTRLYNEMKPSLPAAAQYILTGAHRKRILITVNARELYHISRLREDLHAQWDIKQLTEQMTGLAKKVMPQTMLLIGGKDKYSTIYENVFDRLPRVLPPKE